MIIRWGAARRIRTSLGCAEDGHCQRSSWGAECGEPVLPSVAGEKTYACATRLSSYLEPTRPGHFPHSKVIEGAQLSPLSFRSVFPFSFPLTKGSNAITNSPCSSAFSWRSCASSYDLPVNCKPSLGLNPFPQIIAVSNFG